MDLMYKLYYIVIIFSILRLIVTQHCNIEVIVINGYVEKEGFHRDLVREVKLRADCDVSMCRLMMEESLPSGVYIDMFQIYNMLPFNGPKVLLNASVNVEKPEYESSGFKALVYPTIQLRDGQLFLHSSVPIHLRYHRPAEDASYTRVVVPPPRLYFNCEHSVLEEGDVRAACDMSNTTHCHWRLMLSISAEAIVLWVPVGSSQHTVLVVIVTMVTTVSGCAWIIWTVLNVKIKTS